MGCVFLVRFGPLPLPGFRQILTVLTNEVLLLDGRCFHRMVGSDSELMPVGFLHLDREMAGRFLNIAKRQIPFGVRDVTDLIEPCYRVANMRRIGHRLFACAGKGEGRGW